MMGWLAAALVATGVGVAAVSLLGEGISDSITRPLSSAEVRRELARSSPAPTGTPAVTPTPAPSASPSESAAGPAQLLDTAGGTVVARCVGTQVELTSWSPAQGFRGEGGERGPASTVSVKFESDSREYFVTVDCVSGKPRAHTQADDRRGGGGGGGGHRGKG
jgi:hypothetical protein